MQKPVIVALSLATLVISCGCCIGIAYLAKQDQDHYATLAAACDGRGVPGAPAYQPGTPARIVYFERSAATWVHSAVEVPTPMRGQGVADTALVACGADETTRQVVEQCCFERTVVGVGVPGSDTCYPRVRLAQHVELRVASTGALLAARELLGPMPNACNDWVGRRPSASHFEGDEPDVDELLPFYQDPTAVVPSAPSTVPVVPPGAPVPSKLP